ncbi:carboxylate-amine ligase [Pseudomonas taiwanensis]|uniref:Putative glutamate--cysteine ligase 2 n=1 Tax=Pseudomonas taiwanensis TaxID=470150 RepID=A0ABR6V1G4_9PSED|nr:carboxylate-amine ligase [Pseudomonas taiwanensis]MBC3474358.1 carboxylate-amine ligase [Pseudomonas taiwanensis]MBC3489708.1 carboxylate-amine ligase [Pseudomonas taiwanensis]
MVRAQGFGIEEEYLLVDVTRGDVLARPSHAVARRCREVVGEHFAEEMFYSQIEVASPVLANLHEARSYFTECRHNLCSALAQEGVALYGAASHPTARWQRQHARDQNHYRQVFDDYQMVARRSLLSGLHVHVGVAPEIDRMQLINQMLCWLPLLLVLTTSSPFWYSQVTGYQSYRRVVCGEWPHMDMPEPLADWNAYLRYRTLLQGIGGLAEDGDFWWAIRPSRRFPTIELRICDACPRLEDGLAIAGLFRHLVEQTLRVRQHWQPLGPEQRWIIQENYWRALRHGGNGMFIGAHDRQPVTAHGWLAQLQGLVPADTQDAEHAFGHAARILQDGSSAQRQLAAFERTLAQGRDRRQAFRAVVDQVVGEMTPATG